WPKGPAHHHALNGPYPAGSWPCSTDDRVPARLFNRAAAEAHLKAANVPAADLELKYPDDDPRVAPACSALALQVAEIGDKVGCPIRIRLAPRPPHQLRQDLQKRQYQLAYTHYDFPDDSYSLWPLFAPREEALATGSNYLGYKDDG